MKQKKEYIGLKKGVYTVEDVRFVGNNEKTSIAVCRCSVCGKLSEVRLDRITTQCDYGKHYCVHCREDYFMNIAKLKYIGATKGVLTCIDLIKRSGRLIAICSCSRCNKFTEVRTDRLSTKDYAPQSCEHCYGTLLGSRTKERYQRMYNLSGDEYESAKHDNEKYNKFKAGARSRNLQFLLTKEETLSILHKPCYYCGTAHSDGIDRVDSAKGYTTDNCVPCCGVCNIMKNKFSKELFLQKVFEIYHNLYDEGSTTIPKGSTPQANGGGNGEHPEKDGDIV